MSSERLVLFAFFLFRLQIFLEATPIVSLESLPLESYTILRKFDPIEHIPVASRNLAPEYFTHRNRTVYLTSDQKWVVKIWEEHYPSAPLFVKAFQSGFYNDISKIEALIFDEKDNCRGYITPYMISRNFHRKEWEEKGFALEKNVIGVNVFSPAGKQPKIYQDFFRHLVKKTRD